MATGSYDDPNYDPSQQDWQNQIRQQILAQQQGAEPSAAPTSSSASSTPSPDFNTSTAAAAASPAYADSPAPAAAAAPAWNAPADQPSAAGVGAPGNASNQIQGWYSQWLGRNATDAEIQSHLGNPGGLSAVQNLIANSPEAQAYAQKNKIGPYTPATPAAAPAAGLTNPIQTSTGAYGLSNGYATVPGASDPNQAWKDSIRQIISSRLQADQGPVDENSPQIQAALNASKDALMRQNTTERDALAERLYAQGGGLNTDAVTKQIQQSNERTGTAQGTLRAQLLMSAYKDKFTELNHLLDLATQTGNTEQAQQIQVTLANLQAAVQRENIGANLSEVSAQLNQNAALAGLNP